MVMLATFLLLRCPSCRNEQKYHTHEVGVSVTGFGKKRKSCVYCGKNFGVKDNIIKVV